MNTKTPKKQRLVDFEIIQLEWLEKYKAKYLVPVNAFIRQAVQEKIEKIELQIKNRNGKK